MGDVRNICLLNRSQVLLNLAHDLEKKWGLESTDALTLYILGREITESTIAEHIRNEIEKLSLSNYKELTNHHETVASLRRLWEHTPGTNPRSMLTLFFDVYDLFVFNQYRTPLECKHCSSYARFVPTNQTELFCLCATLNQAVSLRLDSSSRDYVSFGVVAEKPNASDAFYETAKRLRDARLRNISINTDVLLDLLDEERDEDPLKKAIVYCLDHVNRKNWSTFDRDEEEFHVQQRVPTTLDQLEAFNKLQLFNMMTENGLYKEYMTENNYTGTNDDIITFLLNESDHIQMPERFRADNLRDMLISIQNLTDEESRLLCTSEDCLNFYEENK